MNQEKRNEKGLHGSVVTCNKTTDSKERKLARDNKEQSLSSKFDFKNDIYSTKKWEGGEQVKFHCDRYQLFLEQAKDCIFEINCAGYFVFCNASFCKILGRNAEELKKRKYWEFLEEKYRRQAEIIFATIGTTIKMSSNIWKVINDNNKTYTLKIIIQPIINTKGLKIGFRGIGQDVTRILKARSAIINSRKRIEQLFASSRESERRYHGFLNFLPLPLLVRKLDDRVVYINPNFEKIFGWSLDDLKVNPLAYVPQDLQHKSKTGNTRLLQDGEILGFETKRMTKEGILLDVIIDRSVFYTIDDKPDGYVVIFRDVTKNKNDAKTSESFFSIAKAWHHYSDLDSRLSFIARQVQNLLQVQHAHIILVDEEKKEFFFRAGVDSDSDYYKSFYKRRAPLDESFFSGKIILSGKARIINNTNKEKVRRVLGNKNVHNLIGVPMFVENRIIGAMTAANKIAGVFTEQDLALLESISNIVSLPIENARINEELKQSFSEINTLNRAKDRIIEHLSHELRTPLSVLSASLHMLAGSDRLGPKVTARILTRCQRNLNRITEMQAKINDIMRNPNQYTAQSLHSFLEMCVEELESLTDKKIGLNDSAILRQRINKIFTNQTRDIEHIPLHKFIRAWSKGIRSKFTHRKVDFIVEIDDAAGFIDLPVDVFDKVLTGLTRNAIEYTPDGGKVAVKIQGSRNYYLRYRNWYHRGESELNLW